MESAKQLTPLAMAALGLLTERPMHPYEMYQLLMHRHEDRLLKVRPGTLYHAVGRLESAGLVEATGTERDGNRPERTSYAILPAGRSRLMESLRGHLAQPAAEYPRFPQALSEAHNLPAPLVLELLEQRVALLEEKMSGLGSDRDLALSRNVEPAYWIDVGYQEHLLKAEIGWVQDLMGRLADGSLPWPQRN